MLCGFQYSLYLIHFYFPDWSSLLIPIWHIIFKLIMFEWFKYYIKLLIFWLTDSQTVSPSLECLCWGLFRGAISEIQTPRGFSEEFWSSEKLHVDKVAGATSCMYRTSSNRSYFTIRPTTYLPCRSVQSVWRFATLDNCAYIYFLWYTFFFWTLYCHTNSPWSHTSIVCRDYHEAMSTMVP